MNLVGRDHSSASDTDMLTPPTDGLTDNPTRHLDALNSSLEYGNEGSSPKQKKSDGGGEEYIEDDEMEWRKSAKSALQQRPPKTYKVREPCRGSAI